MLNSSVPTLLPVYKRMDVAFERGLGAQLWDDRGRRYLDFGSGIAVTGLGHCHPHLVEALTSQANALWHTSNLYEIPALQKLADRLVANSFAETVFVCNSGAEAIEITVKMARRHFFARGLPGRHRVITFEGAFHGRTMTGISAVPTPKMAEGFAPLLEGFDVVPFGDLAAVQAAIGPSTAAILIEPIQGEGGIRAAEPGFLAALRQLCDEHDMLLLFDEVQCGLGRTGNMFAYEGMGVVPDIMALAKGLGGGFPIGACLATARAAAGMTYGTHGSTFGGNPLGSAVANAVLDVMLKEGFMADAARRAGVLRERLQGMAARHPEMIAEVRGKGFILGLRTVQPAGDVVARFMELGLVTIPASDNVVRLLPPLTVTLDEIEEGVGIIEQAASRAEAA
ncbi:acetylornithine aminotransferase apoenzyme [Arboricoccus pini]|uniref:Acetylornithine aminotransferase n=1 Tax=Arboricoccus pini TaxID=1963835 RepID=A0A212PYY9_9PROT|nr:aspartate aminotransferase family protein [Arboricoccus pini]SNB52230.1 acetylornithine aminotransferase apoenzyme [Arboricoccus pini]